MSAKEQAQAAKNRGNAAFSAGDNELAVKEFTAAIELDSTDHVFWSNRSGAWGKMAKYDKALEDANKCVELKPDWGKGYVRQGYAYHMLKKYDEATAAYEKGLKVEPGNAGCQSGLKEVQEAKSVKENPMGNLFGPDMWPKLYNDETTREYLKDPAFVQKLKMMQGNPNAFSTAFSGGDPRMQAVLGVILGLGSRGFSAMGGDKAGDMFKDDDVPMKPADQKQTQESKMDDDVPYEEEEVDHELENEKREEAKRKKQALEFKDKGNEFYKKKEFDKALEMYNKALEVDPDSLALKTNKAAVYFEQKEYAQCEALCREAIAAATGSKGYDYKSVAKAWFRLGNAQDKQGNLQGAIESYNKSLLEDNLPSCAQALKKLELKKKEQDEKAYIDPVKSEEHKNKGNEFFKDQKWTDAIREYTEALKRDPSNYKVYSNRAGCYTKLMDWNRGLEDCDKCIDADPKFVKAYIRKGKIQHFLKQYHKALETYQRGLDLDPNATELIEGKRATMAAINAENNSGNIDPSRQAEAMKDPEIQSILSDPLMNNILKNMQSDPASAQRAMADPTVRAKIEKLVAAGVLQVR